MATKRYEVYVSEYGGHDYVASRITDGMKVQDKEISYWVGYVYLKDEDKIHGVVDIVNAFDGGGHISYNKEMIPKLGGV